MRRKMINVVLITILLSLCSLKNNYLAQAEESKTADISIRFDEYMESEETNNSMTTSSTSESQKEISDNMKRFPMTGEMMEYFSLVLIGLIIVLIIFSIFIFKKIIQCRGGK